jgi:hypothetical protein
MQRNVDIARVNYGSATLQETQSRHAPGQLRLGGVPGSAEAIFVSGQGKLGRIDLGLAARQQIREHPC